MKYENIQKAVFIDRPNRFIANIDIQGERELCHVKNTGRCRELLIPGAEIYVQCCDSPTRKTRYDLISVRRGDRLVNIDSGAPNRIFAEWVQCGGLFGNIALLRTEQTFGDSRFDFYAEADGKRAYIEVKGVTLERDGAALFPDAPTQRGVRHLNELIKCVEAGFDAYIVFVVQMEGAQRLEPNRGTHPQFAEALSRAVSSGVHALAIDCRVGENEITAERLLPVIVAEGEKNVPTHSSSYF